MWPCQKNVAVPEKGRGLSGMGLFVQEEVKQNLHSDKELELK